MKQDLLNDIRAFCARAGWSEGYFARRYGHGRLIEQLLDPSKSIRLDTIERVRGFIADQDAVLSAQPDGAARSSGRSVACDPPQSVAAGAAADRSRSVVAVTDDHHQRGATTHHAGGDMREAG